MDRPDSPQAPDAADPDPTGGLLTARELELVRALISGGTTSRAAAVLGISPYTVNRHLDNMRNKLGLRATVQIVGLAIRKGWV